MLRLRVQSVFNIKGDDSLKDPIYFAKVKPDAIIPSKREEDGCFDIYACFDEPFICISPGEIKLIPTGIASAFDKKYRADLRERGSTGMKGLSRRSGQIDSGYRNEWFIQINNTTSKPIAIVKDMGMFEKYKEQMSFTVWNSDREPETTFYNVEHTIYPYTKAICQMALEFVPDVDVNEIPYEELLEMKSERMLGKLGSSEK